MKKHCFLRFFLYVTLCCTPCLGAMNDEPIIIQASMTPHAEMGEAIQADNLKQVKILMSQHHPEKLVHLGQTPLHIAIRKGKKEIFDYLIKETVFGTWRWVNQATIVGDKCNNTPLLTCVKKATFTDDDFDVMHQLLMRGANINARDNDDYGTPLWVVASLRAYGEHLQLAQFLTWSGTDLSLMCKHIHSNRGYDIPRGCTARERAFESGYEDIADFLEIEEHMNHTLVELLEDKKDPTIQQNLYARAVFYEKYDVLWVVMELMKRIKNVSTMEDIERDVVKMLLSAEYLERLNLILEQGFACEEQDYKAIKRCIERCPGQYANTGGTFEIMLDKIVLDQIMLDTLEMVRKCYYALGVNKQTRSLKAFSRNDVLSDVICFCNNQPLTEFTPYTPPSRKRVLKRGSLPVAKETKQ